MTRAAFGDVRVRPYGPRAFLLEVGSPAPLAALVAAVDGVEEVVPGACTLLVRHDGRPDVASAVVGALREWTRMAASTPPTGVPVLDIDVVYDGPDLADVAARTGMSTQQVVGVHTSIVYEVAFCGFSPGFAYMTGVPDSLVVARLDTPRPRVPAGSVALAGPYTAIYPSESPGGWNLLGRTDAVVWDVHADPPALLSPGTRVRFRAVGA